MRLTACPTCGNPMTPATLAAHIQWAEYFASVDARRSRSRHIHPSNHRPTPDSDGAA